MARKNGNLNTAKKAKNDEFYTQYADIEKELQHYIKHLKDKIVYCNCDNPEWSNFWKYFYNNYHSLELKGLISTHYVKDGKSYILEYNGIDVVKTELNGDGDFRSDECIEILKGCDIVITNPPFSLFRLFIAQLIEYDKKFLVIGSQNAITYKEIFPLLKDNKIWLGNNHVKEFRKPDGTIQKFGNICWYTNLDIKKRHEPLVLTKRYTPKEYPRYDNYNAINVNKIADIPCDYDKYIGVPLTYIEKHNPDEFEIIGVSEECGVGLSCGIKDEDNKTKHPLVNGNKKYARIFIKPKEDDIVYSGIIGVPISFLENFNPEQFEILGLTSGRNEFDKETWPIKKYEKAIQHNKDGSTANGSKANTRATLIANDITNKTYYTADNTDANLEIVYARILIRKKPGKNENDNAKNK
jgi:hypothetical protein